MVQVLRALATSLLVLHLVAAGCGSSGASQEETAIAGARQGSYSASSSSMSATIASGSYS